jgi:hypothetical protein
MLLGPKWIKVERFPVVRTGSAVSRQQGFQSRRRERARLEGSNASSDLVEQLAQGRILIQTYGELV